MGARVLVIEDNAANLELITYLLHAFGHIALAARDGKEGVASAFSDVPDLILCDLALPEMDGWEVARLVRLEPRLARVPIIAVTASAMVGDRERVIRAGFDGYIMKPITPETFVQEVEGFLRVPRRHADDSHR